ncbi:MAG: HAMP domain-containing histidine kinase [Oscillospiraceae bacterium]|nr:HAMP domain-containing histidine kinase [Oscillospiraceae bacterium]
MIKKLRRKIITISTVLLMAVLIVVLVYTYHSTRYGLDEATMEALQTAAAELVPPNRPGRTELSKPCFSLRLSSNGELIAMGSDYYDLDDPDYLMGLLTQAQSRGTESGYLKQESLRFLRREEGRGMAVYVFTDVSSEMQTLSRLNLTCGLLAVVGLAVFFLLSVLLARWTVRPVEQAWEQQRQFVADASHELKTPLTVILTNAELLTSEEYDATSKNQFATSILTMSRQMRGLVEELLDQARVDNGRAQVEHRPLDYSKLVSDAVLPFEPVYFEAGKLLECQVEPGITVSGSVDHLRRVVEILLDNGCKYSAAGAVVQLRLQRHGRGCLLCVSSPGQPMTAQQCRDIFKRFYRVDTARAMNRSYGLGLSIAQGIVEQHRGKIWAESQNGINQFYVNLPL